MRTTFLLYLCLLITLTSKAQVIKGRISDAGTSQSIPFANLALAGQVNPSGIRYLSTDTSGNFEFRQIPNGRYTLTASLIGYQKIQMKFTINADSMKVMDLGNMGMTEDPNLLQTVTINGGTPAFATRNGQINIGIAGNTFFKSTANLMDVFRKLPGLQVTRMEQCCLEMVRAQHFSWMADQSI
ncbi:carboxypeptidase-like regulatory domain-containing protein [Pedobacter sp. NJ-S-72]